MFFHGIILIDRLIINMMNSLYQTHFVEMNTFFVLMFPRMFKASVFVTSRRELKSVGGSRLDDLAVSLGFSISIGGCTA